MTRRVHPKRIASDILRAVKREAARERRSRRWASDCKHFETSLDCHMDDPDLLNPLNTPSDGVIFGTYGPDEWATSTFLRSAMEQGKNTLIIEGTWITPANWTLHEFVLSITSRFNFMSDKRALVFWPWGVGECTVSRGKLHFELNGEPTDVMALVKKLDGQLKRAENLIEWVYGAHGESTSVPLNYRPAIQAAYPWLDKPVLEFIDDYLDSKASVIILIGPPGTGKTTFIKNLIHRSGGDAKVTYDEKIMNSDSLFANFIESEERFLIMEDADAFLGAREDGNTMMHRFLNVSDGLISAEGKKLVFSTNLPNIHDIDTALLRPGRCYAIVEFRSLTRAEAQNVLDEIGADRDLPDGDSFTLAELFNVQPNGETQATRRVGFF